MSGLSTALGIGFIVWGVIVQDPPETALPIGMIILGSLALFVGLWGLLISIMGRCCMAVLLLLAFLVSIGELALTIRLMVDMESSVNALVENTMNSYKDTAKEAAGDLPDNPKNNRRLFQVRKTKEELTTEYTNDLQYARYIFFVFALIELLLVIATLIIKWRRPYADGVEGDEEDQLAAKSTMAQIQLEGLKSSVSSQNGNDSFYSTSKKAYRSVTKKMTQKYGEFSHDAAWSSSGKKWWQSIPGTFGFQPQVLESTPPIPTGTPLVRSLRLSLAVSFSLAIVLDHHCSHWPHRPSTSPFRRPRLGLLLQVCHAPVFISSIAIIISYTDYQKTIRVSLPVKLAMAACERPICLRIS